MLEDPGVHPEDGVGGAVADLARDRERALVERARRLERAGLETDAGEVAERRALERPVTDLAVDHECALRALPRLVESPGPPEEDAVVGERRRLQPRVADLAVDRERPAKARGHRVAVARRVRHRRQMTPCRAPPPPVPDP